MYAYTLILVCWGSAKADFEAIAAKVAAGATDIRPVVIQARSQRPPAGDLWSRPALTVAFCQTFDLVPQRGPVLRPRFVGKINQSEMFRKAGLATPKTGVFQFGMKPDPAEWSDYVILKPMRITSKGRGIHLVRTRKVPELSFKLFKHSHPIYLDQYLIQRYVDTGDYPVHYRVETLLGEALCCRTIFSTHKRPPLAASDGALFAAKMASNADTRGANQTQAAKDDDVIAFARRMDVALPDIPIKGCDILREVATGQLYALECNPGGLSWAFSSDDGDNARAAFGGKQGMVDHLGAWDAAARALIARTRADAR